MSRRNRFVLTLAALLTAVEIFFIACGGAISEDAPTPDPGITFWHDDAHKVGCWMHHVWGGTSISCLPDAEYTR